MRERINRFASLFIAQDREREMREIEVLILDEEDEVEEYFLNQEAFNTTHPDDLSGYPQG